MGTTIKPELSKKNKYWIEKHRFYELKHFVMQYDIWYEAYRSLDGLSKKPTDLLYFSNEHGDPTVRCVEAKEYFYDRIKLVERAADETDPVIGSYILEVIVTGSSYDKLRACKDVPCCREVFYDLYHKFFWILNKTRK